MEEIKTGKIIKAIAGFYYVHTRTAGVYACRARGIFRKDGRKPLVGDDAEILVLDEEKKEGSLERLLPRRNVLIRPAVANIDQALIVFAVREPDPNLNLLDRFLIYMGMQEIPVVIFFNKTDLDWDSAAERYRAVYEAAGYTVITGAVHAEENAAEERCEAAELAACVTGAAAENADSRAEGSGEGVQTAPCGGDGRTAAAEELSRETEAQIRAVLSGKTTVLAGPSGVGKSSLTNLLHAEARMEVGALSEKIRRGKQTTRHTELFSLPESGSSASDGKQSDGIKTAGATKEGTAGTYLLDTPGFTSLLLPGLPPGEVRCYFPEFLPEAERCRFSGCAHISEPEKLCGVKQALSAGRIDRQRYEDYVQIYGEQKQAAGRY